MNDGNGLVRTIEIKDKHGRVVETKEVVTYAGLLNRAHQEGLKSIRTRLVQTPSAANEMTAISLAEVVTDKGVFRDYGDANPGNVTGRIVPHIIRMAVTRAKARALRDAINVGVIALEELGQEFSNGNGVDGTAPKAVVPAAGKQPASEKNPPRTAPTNGGTETKQHGRAGNGSGTGNDPMTENQRRYLFRILAEHGVTGDIAHDYLVQTFGVGSLKEVTKREASDLIEELLANAQELLSGVAVT